MALKKSFSIILCISLLISNIAFQKKYVKAYESKANLSINNSLGNISELNEKWEVNRDFRQFYDIAYNGFLYIAVGNEGGIKSSENGVEWKSTYTDPFDTLKSVAYGKGLFVAVGYENEKTSTNGIIKTSTNGITWNTAYFQFNTQISSITYNNNTFIAIGNNGLILLSHDGISWETIEPIISNSFYNITYLLNAFYITTSNGTFLKSEDGYKWTIINTDTSSKFQSIAYGNGKYVAVANNFVDWLSPDGEIAVSTDGVSWKTVKYGSEYKLNYVKYIGDKFIAIGDQGRVYYSVDGFTWNLKTIDSNLNLKKIIYFNNKYIMLTNTNVFLSSFDGQVWEPQEDRRRYNFADIEFGNGKYVTTEGGGSIHASDDGVNFHVAKRFEVDTIILDIIFNGNIFVAIANTGQIFTSSDGESWTEQNSNTTNFLNSIAWGNGRFIVLGYGGVVLTSTDAVNWEFVQLSGLNFYDNKVFFIGGKFLVSGGQEYISSDGVNWRKIDANIGVSYAFYIKGKYYLVNSMTNEIHVSSDLINWSSKLIPTDYSNQSIRGCGYIGDKIIITGTDGLVLKTSDGINFIKDSLPISDTFNLVKYIDGRLDLYGLYSIISSYYTDLNHDNKVNILDVALVARGYNQTNSIYQEYDLNKDSIIDIYDIVIVSKDMN